MNPSVRVNALPSVLSARRVIPVAKPFQAPPERGGDWSELGVELVQRPRRRWAGPRSTLAPAMVVTLLAGFALTSWGLNRGQHSSKRQPVAVAVLPAVTQVPVVMVEARQRLIPAVVQVETPHEAAVPVEAPQEPAPVRATEPKPEPPAPAVEPRPVVEATAQATVAAPATSAIVEVKAVAKASAVAEVTASATPPVATPAPEPAAKAETCTTCAKKGSYGTSLVFAESPIEAAKQAAKENKLMFVLHISGNFEDDKFT
jgi:hypothetical protein